jgi:hypothetical protein
MRILANRHLLIVLAGESTQNRGYVFFSEVQFIPEADLKAIVSLWKYHSNKKFGFSVQKREENFARPNDQINRLATGGFIGLDRALFWFFGFRIYIGSLRQFRFRSGINSGLASGSSWEMKDDGKK